MHIAFGSTRADKLSKRCLAFDPPASGDPGLTAITRGDGLEDLVGVPCPSESLLRWPPRTMAKGLVIKVLSQLACRAGSVTHENSGMLTL